MPLTNRGPTPSLAQAEPNFWFDVPRVHPLRALKSIEGALAALALSRDWLGDQDILVPFPPLLLRLSLSTPIPGGPLAWLDQDGRPGIAMRSWRRIGDRDSDVESYVLEGCDLLVRPDMFDRVRAMCRHPIREGRQVHRQDLADPTG